MFDKNLEGNKAAIPPDELLDTPLANISAAEFIRIINKHSDLSNLTFISEKKKYELEVEPIFERLTLRDFGTLIDKIKGEKKKVEYEVPDSWKWKVNPPYSQLDISQRLDQLVDRLDGIEKRIGR